MSQDPNKCQRVNGHCIKCDNESWGLSNCLVYGINDGWAGEHVLEDSSTHINEFPYIICKCGYTISPLSNPDPALMAKCKYSVQDHIVGDIIE